MNSIKNFTSTKSQIVLSGYGDHSKKKPQKSKTNWELRATLIKEGLLEEAPCDCRKLGKRVPYKWNNKTGSWDCTFPECGAKHVRRRLCPKTGKVLS